MDRRAFNRSMLGAGLAATFGTSGALAAAAKSLSKVTGDLPAITRTGGETTLSRAAIKEFQASLRGPLILPDNVAYDKTRAVWNGMIDKHPALIARCAGAADVINAVQFAGSNDLLVAVRGGGHSISGQSVCEGGLMIDLSPMQWATVNPELRRVRIGAGTLLGELDHASQQFGLATTTGTVSHTGAAGLTLGGGHGRLARRFGLAADNVRSVDLVTASGELVVASARENQDLYWGVRGGGGNFGIVTSFEYDLHEVGPTVLNGLMMYQFSDAKDVLKFYAEFAQTAPRELTVDVIMLSPPGARSPILMLSFCHTGDFDEGQRLIDQFRAFRKPRVDQVSPKSYLEVQSSADANTPAGVLYYNKSGLMGELAPEAVDEIVDRLSEAAGQADPGVASNVIIQHLGGAVGDVAPGDTAYPHRDARHDFLILSGWKNPDFSEQNIKWLRDAYATIDPYTIGFYSNHMVDSDQPKVRFAYRGNYDRMVQLKNKYDPQNRFRLNANVQPTV